jgi:hypothetical protein
VSDVNFFGGLSGNPKFKKVRLGGHEFRNLDAFVAEFGALVGLPGTKLADEPPLASNARFEGALASGRAASVSFHAERSQGDEPEVEWYGDFAVEVSRAPPFSVTRETWWSQLGKWAGLVKEIEVGNEAFDNRFLVQTTEPARAREALGVRDTYARIHKLFASSGTTCLRCDGGRLEARARVQYYTQKEFGNLLGQLEALAAILGRVHVEVHGVASPLLALEGERGPRCAYCHDALRPGEAGLLACALCSTVLHAACWEDLGRCPVLGCAGKDPTPARSK